MRCRVGISNDVILDFGFALFGRLALCSLALVRRYQKVTQNAMGLFGLLRSLRN